MTSKPAFLLVAAAIALGAGAVSTAGDAGAQTTQPKQDRPQPAPRPNQPAAAAAPAAKPEEPQRVETIVYDSWTVTCRGPVATPNKKNCWAMLRVVDNKQGKVLFAWIIGKTPEGVLTAVIQTPTGVQVQRGVELKLGNAGGRKLSFMSCEPQQCEATVPIDDAMARELVAASEAVATIYAKDGRGINFTMPMKGVDKALAAARS